MVVKNQSDNLHPGKTARAITSEVSNSSQPDESSSTLNSILNSIQSFGKDKDLEKSHIYFDINVEDKNDINDENKFKAKNMINETLKEIMERTIGSTRLSSNVIPNSNISITCEPLLYNRESIQRESKASQRNSLTQTTDINSYCASQIFKKHQTVRKMKQLRYREEVFRAATKLSTEMPPFPNWIYSDCDFSTIDVMKINVGGTVFLIGRELLMMLSNTTLSICLKKHTSSGKIFIDRDPVSFRPIHHFYCTGRLHLPANVCSTLFQQELEFWGVSDDFLEPCCWTLYRDYRNASDRLLTYSEDCHKSRQYYVSQTNLSTIDKFRNKLFNIITGDDNSIPAKWMNTLGGIFIIVSVFLLILSTSTMGRTSLNNHDKIIAYTDVKEYFRHTYVIKFILVSERLLTGYFIAEVSLRFILTRAKIEFFRDIIVWIDIFASFGNLASLSLVGSGNYANEMYVYVIKLPRLLRLIRLTETLRSGVEAFVLTIKACASEIKVIFTLFTMCAISFGCLIFVAEYNGKNTTIHNVADGIWLAVVSMAGLGYGDVVPKLIVGKFMLGIMIPIGLVISQMPVPIFLRNFSMYYNQASARLVSQSRLLLSKNIMKEVEQKRSADLYFNEKFEKKREFGIAKFNKLFSRFK